MNESKLPNTVPTSEALQIVSHWKSHPIPADQINEGEWYQFVAKLTQEQAGAALDLFNAVVTGSELRLDKVPRRSLISAAFLIRVPADVQAQSCKYLWTMSGRWNAQIPTHLGLLLRGRWQGGVLSLPVAAEQTRKIVAVGSPPKKTVNGVLNWRQALALAKERAETPGQLDKEAQIKLLQLALVEWDSHERNRNRDYCPMLRMWRDRLIPPAIETKEWTPSRYAADVMAHRFA